MIHERSTGVKDDTKSFDLNNGKMELSLTERGRTEEGVDILNAKFEMLSDIQIETSQGEARLKTHFKVISGRKAKN